MRRWILMAVAALLLLSQGALAAPTYEGTDQNPGQKPPALLWHRITLDTSTTQSRNFALGQSCSVKFTKVGAGNVVLYEVPTSSAAYTSGVAETTFTASTTDAYTFKPGLGYGTVRAASDSDGSIVEITCLNDGTFSGGGGGGVLGSGSIAEMTGYTGSKEVGDMWMVDNNDAGDCSTAAGTGTTWCGWNGTSWEPIGSAGAGLANIVEDLSPQLGGDLDAQGNDITNVGNMPEMVYDSDSSGTIDQEDVYAAVKRACTAAGNLLYQCRDVVMPPGTIYFDDTLYLSGRCVDLYDTGGPPQTSGSPDGLCDTDGVTANGANGVPPSSGISGQGLWSLTLRGAGGKGFLQQTDTGADNTRCGTNVRWRGATEGAVIHLHGARDVVLSDFCIVGNDEQDAAGEGSYEPAKVAILLTADNTQSEVSLGVSVRDMAINMLSTNMADEATYSSYGVMLAPSNWNLSDEPPFSTQVQIDHHRVTNSLIYAHRGWLGANGFTNGNVMSDNRVYYKDYAYWAEDSDLHIRGGYAGSLADVNDGESGVEETACLATQAALVIGSTSTANQPKNVSVMDWNVEADCGIGLDTVIPASSQTTLTRDNATFISNTSFTVGGAGTTYTGDGQRSIINYQHYGVLSIVGGYLGVRNAETFEDGMIYAHPPTGGAKTLDLFVDSANIKDWDAATFNVVTNAAVRRAVDANNIEQSDDFAWTGAHDFGGGTLEVPNSTTLPGTCAVGQIYMDTDATSGQRIYACESANTWVLQGDGGGGGGGDEVTFNSTAAASPVNFVDAGVTFIECVDSADPHPSCGAAGDWVLSLATGSVTATHLANNSVAQAELADDAVGINELDLVDGDTPTNGECLTYSTAAGGSIATAACGSFDATTIDAVTWSDGANASNAWTFNVSGTDPVVTWGNGTVDFSTPITATSFTSDPSDTAEMRLTSATGSDEVAIGLTDNGSSTNMDFTVDDGTGDDQQYLLLDGANQMVTASKPIQLGSAGVRLSGDGDGAVTLLGLGNGSDEDLTINLDDTADTVALSSSTGVTTIDAGSIGFLTSGAIRGNVDVVVTTSGTRSPSCNELRGTMHIADNATATADVDYTLPEISTCGTGASACFYDNGAGTGGVIIDAASGDEILLAGTGIGTADAIDSPGVAGDGANGDFICLLAIDANTWITLGASGTWVDGGAD